MSIGEYIQDIKMTDVALRKATERCWKHLQEEFARRLGDSSELSPSVTCALTSQGYLVLMITVGTDTKKLLVHPCDWEFRSRLLL